MEMTRHRKPLRPGFGVAPPEALYSRIRADVETTPASTVRTRMRIVAALAVVPVLTAIIVLIASEVVYGRQAVGLQTGVQSMPKFFLVSCLLVGLVFASTTIAVWRGRGGLGAGAVCLALAAGLVAPIYAALIVPSPVHLHDAGVPGVEISAYGLRCFVMATVVGAMVIVSLAAALRSAVPVASRLRGAVLGAAAGAWAGLAVFVFCPSGEQPHLLLGHVLPIVGFTVLGGFVLSRTLRP